MKYIEKASSTEAGAATVKTINAIDIVVSAGAPYAVDVRVCVVPAAVHRVCSMTSAAACLY